jgi:hypothetical protein
MGRCCLSAVRSYWPMVFTDTMISITMARPTMAGPTKGAPTTAAFTEGEDERQALQC